MQHRVGPNAVGFYGIFQRVDTPATLQANKGQGVLTSSSPAAMHPACMRSCQSLGCLQTYAAGVEPVGTDTDLQQGQQEGQQPRHKQ